MNPNPNLDLAFFCKLAIYTLEKNIHPYYEEKFHQFYHQVFCDKPIPENIAIVGFLFAKFVYFSKDRAIKIADNLQKLSNILLDRPQEPFPNLIEAYDENELMNRIKDVNFYYVRNEGEPSLEDFKLVCAELSDPDYQGNKIVDRHLGYSITEGTRFLARYFSSENFGCDCVETREYECLRMLETIFNEHFVIKCTKPSASISFFSDFAKRF